MTTVDENKIKQYPSLQPEEDPSHGHLEDPHLTTISHQHCFGTVCWSVVVTTLEAPFPFGFECFGGEQVGSPPWSCVGEHKRVQ